MFLPGLSLRCDRWLSLVFVLCTLLCYRSEAMAATYDFSAQPTERPLNVVINQTMVLDFGSDVGQAIIGDPATADVLPISARSIYVQGRKIGTTNLTVFSPDRSRQILFTVQVTPDIATLKRVFADIAPGTNIKVTPSNGRLILTGEVPDAVTAERLTLVAKDFSENVTNAMVIRSGQQVMLEVWFLEVRRGASKELGVTLAGGSGRFSGSSTPRTYSTDGDGLTNNLAAGANSIVGGATAIISGSNLSARVDALEQRSLARQLANPNLVAISGRKAYFNSGGKVPYTTSSQLSSTTQFISYGVNLTFVPTVLGNGVINLEVAAGVSALDNKTYGEGSSNPGIIERVTETAVELRNGEALMIAGLTNAEMLRNVDQTPGLGDLPILGALFRSSDFRNNESELVIIISPHLVDPAKNRSQLKSPLDQRKLTNEIEFFGTGSPETAAPSAKPKHPAIRKDGVAPSGHVLTEPGVQ